MATKRRISAKQRQRLAHNKTPHQREATSDYLRVASELASMADALNASIGGAFDFDRNTPPTNVTTLPSGKTKLDYASNSLSEADAQSVAHAQQLMKAAKALRLVAKHGLPKSIPLSEQKANDAKRYQHIAFVYELLKQWQESQERLKQVRLRADLGAAVGMSARNIYAMCIKQYGEQYAPLARSALHSQARHRLDQALLFFKRDSRAKYAELVALLKANRPKAKPSAISKR